MISLNTWPKKKSRPSRSPNVLAVLLPCGARRQIAPRGAAQIDAPAIRQGHRAKGCEDDLVPGSQPGTGWKIIKNPREDDGFSSKMG
jgi:hypothetical protein